MSGASRDDTSEGVRDPSARNPALASAFSGWRPDSFENVAPAVIFLVVAICIGADFLGDILRREGHVHLVGMAVGTVLLLAGLAIMVRILAKSWARARTLTMELDRSRADAMRWKAQAGEMLQGLGTLIDQQFGEWALSPSEREVGLLLLKGLSLKDIAAARKASEATVRQQAQAIYRKAHLTGRAELSAFFLEDLLLPRVSTAETLLPVSAVGPRSATHA